MILKNMERLVWGNGLSPSVPDDMQDHCSGGGT